MNKKVLILSAIALVVLLALGGLLYRSLEFEKVTGQLNAQLMKANLEIGKAETKFGNAKKYIGQLEVNLRKEIKNNKEEITRYGELEASYNIEVNRKNVGEVKVVTKERIVYKNLSKDQQFTEGLWYQADTVTSLKLLSKIDFWYRDVRLEVTGEIFNTPNHVMNFTYQLKMKFLGNIVETITASGARNFYLNIFEADENGVILGKIKLEQFWVTINDETRPKFYWWAPHIDIGIAAGLTTKQTLHLGGSLGFTPFGYGLTKNDLAWKFARVSLDLNSTLSVGVTPFLYNLGAEIPLFSNLWLGPYVSRELDKDKAWTIGLVLGASL